MVVVIHSFAYLFTIHVVSNLTFPFKNKCLIFYYPIYINLIFLFSEFWVRIQIPFPVTAIKFQFRYDSNVNCVEHETLKSHVFIIQYSRIFTIIFCDFTILRSNLHVRFIRTISLQYECKRLVKMLGTMFTW